MGPSDDTAKARGPDLKKSAPRNRSHASQRSEDVLGLQESVRLPRIRSRLRARKSISHSAPMDSVPASNQGQRRAQSLLRIQGAILVSRRAAMGQAARPGDSRAVESLRHDAGADRRPLRGTARPPARLQPSSLRDVLSPRTRGRPARRRRGRNRKPRHVRRRLSQISFGEGAAAYQRAQDEAAADHVFGVPMFFFDGEPFWGHDRLPILEERLTEAGLAADLAHKAIAHLMAEGYVRVILTTNFDRLLESALEAEGVKATILSTPDSIDGALPLVHTRRCVLKLHGDYQDTRIMNTSGEVSTYDGRTNKLLDQILDEFGLIVCGWSADWDEALRSAIKRCQSRRFTTYWTTLGNLTKAASQLVELRRSRVIEINSADSFFAELSEKVNSLADLSRQRPLDDALEVAALKRYLTEPKYRIELRDLLTAEREKLHKQLFSDQFRAQGVQPTADAVVERVAMYESATERMRDLLITGCYYGESQHLPLWVECLERTVTFPGPEAGFDTWTTLRRYPALLLLYAGGLQPRLPTTMKRCLGCLQDRSFE